MPWAAASASASRAKVASARVADRVGELGAPARLSRIVAQRRCGRSSVITSTVDLGRPLPGAGDLGGGEPDRAGDHRVDGRLHHGEVGAGIDQGAEQHVAGDPGRGVDPGVRP